MAHDKPDLTDIFIELSNTPSEINEQHMKMLEIFRLKVYNIDPSYTDIDEARLNYFFKSPDPKLRLLILSQKALFQHTLRSALTDGWIWIGCTTNIIIPDPTRWGWIRSSESSVRYYPNWLRKCC